MCKCKGAKVSGHNKNLIWKDIIWAEAEVQEVVPRLSARSSGDQVKELGDI
ncbi:hypothetical protein L914_16760 [Phytophthora nicotianae]|uniref:Uncharacterized protein n=1 Tax=Phytophthora nicotianae TaxID=4792 RepID=W2MM79_PHYNI|nr:hypothetical protein L914_16760 [Phytophthora nicotianae]